MVALLMDRGRADAAVDLEERWNELGQTKAFSLLCAYPSLADADADADAGDEDDRAQAYARICDLHSDVVADQPQPDDAQCSCAFARGPAAPSQARRFVTDTLRQWELHELIDPANLIVSELATNAVVHARSGFTVSLNHDGPVVRIAVGDGAGGIPHRGVAGTDAPRGRGLPIIEAVAARWGHLALDRGKLVWAELSGDSPLTAAACST
jgi:anti-sigma regulatory factor (Ser/Thr protein kinase)